MGSLPQPEVRRVAIVGAGSGGVAAAKYLLAEDSFKQIDIFEQQSDFGGVWNYSGEEKNARVPIPQTDPTLPQGDPQWKDSTGTTAAEGQHATFMQPMYEGLETNIPHVLMRYSDALSLQQFQLFPTREEVLDYLKTYSESVRDLVHFHTQVINVSLQTDGIQDTWTVESEDLSSGKTSRTDYDALVVANGHYSVPSLPNICGIKEWSEAYPGVISHSKFYRNTKGFENKKVLVVGNSASGTDITSQIQTVSKHPIYVSQRSDSPLAYQMSFKTKKPEIAEFLPPAFAERAVRFVDGSILAEIDAVLFCTGYFYSFPFLSSLEPQLISTGERVQHLYRHLFYIPHPSLAFIGLPSKIIPFRTCEGQAAVVARVWSGRLDLPAKQEMEEWEQQELAKTGAGRAFHVLKFPNDFQYHNEMVDWSMEARQTTAGRVPPKWSDKELWQRERFPELKRAFAERGEKRRAVKTVEDLGFKYEEAVSEGQHRSESCSM